MFCCNRDAKPQPHNCCVYMIPNTPFIPQYQVGPAFRPQCHLHILMGNLWTVSAERRSTSRVVVQFLTLISLLSASVGSSVDSESESDGGEDVPSTWETITEHAPFTKHPSADNIPYIGADAQSESEEDNAPSQGNLAETNTNQSNNVLLTAQFLRTPLRCHRPLPVIRVLQARLALSSSTDRCPQFV